jgi:beta-1,4-mannooligosaccharide/beta-1,4-mannosyl-N-acetylglucosamine phosphorylase
MQRFINNPLITRKEIVSDLKVLTDVSSVFNPGAVKFGDEHILILRVQNRGRQTLNVVARSNDGLKFKIDSKPIVWKNIEKYEHEVFHCYDCRITKLENRYYIVFAMDITGSCELGLAVTDDFEEFEFLGAISNTDVRNGVLFPEKINGKYYRLDRPNRQQVENGPVSGSSIYCSSSENLLDWEQEGLVAAGNPHYWDELIGSGPPPIKTEKGWLHIYHGIALHYQPIYQAGVMLLDLNDPTKVIARSKFNILEPREEYELAGQVPNVVFPSGMIVDQYDENGFALPESKVKIYYGAADTVIGLATSTIRELLDLCED